ncbi:MAG: hypothetical protein ABSF91_07920 [Bacteroidota bacterium]|jgi:hypothetical protein
MGVLKRLSFNWDQLAGFVISAMTEKDQTIEESMKGIYYASCAERCRVADDLLSFFRDDNYKRKIIQECNILVKAFDLAVGGSQKEKTDALLIRVSAMAATIAYCQQFALDNGVDAEFLYLIYKRVLHKFGLSTLI